MSLPIQLELFPESAEERRERELKELRENFEKMRKMYYAKDNAQDKKINDLEHKLETLIVAACKNENMRECFIR